MNEATRLFERAAEAVRGDALLSARVRRERLSLDLVWLYRYKALKPIAQRAGFEFLGPGDPVQGMNDFIETAQRFGIKDYSEGRAFTDEIPWLKDMFAVPIGLPESARQGHPFDVIDIQQNRISVDKVESRIEDDVSASDGQAVAIRGDTVSWAAQAALNRVLRGWANEKWEVHAMVRVEPRAGLPLTGVAIRAGFQDLVNGDVSGETELPLNKRITAGYQDVVLGATKLHADMRVWFAATRNPAVEKIYIDRVFLLRRPDGDATP